MTTRKTRQDFAWQNMLDPQYGRQPVFHRMTANELGISKFQNMFNPNTFAELESIIARIKTVSPQYIRDTTGSLDVGAMLSGESEYFIRRENRKSKSLRLGINPSNMCMRSDVAPFKCAAYAAIAMVAKKLGYIVECELAYGGMSEKALRRFEDSAHSPVPFSVRVELGNNLPPHLIAAYGSTQGIEVIAMLRESKLQHEYGKCLEYVHYQSQDDRLAKLFRAEYDIAFDRLLERDTPGTIEDFMYRNLSQFAISNEDLDHIISHCRKLNLYKD